MSNFPIQAKRILSRTLLILFGIGLTLGVCEIGQHIFPVPNRLLLQKILEQQWLTDEEFLMKLKPNLDMRIYGHPDFNYTVRTNSDGLRDEPFEGEFDIAAIGDSFAFGFGVEEHESWPARLEGISSTRVANLGWAGWSSCVYPRTIERYAIPLNTRIWVWGFFLNDLTESAGAHEFLSSEETDYFSWIKNYGQRSSDLAFPFNLRTTQLLAAIFNPELFLLPGSGSILFDDGTFQMRVSTISWDLTDPQSPDVQHGWEITEQALRQVQELAQSNDATLIVFFIPSREHVYWPHIRSVLPGFDVSQLDDIEKRISMICEELSIDYLNLLPRFQESAEHGEMLYFHSDGHWNPNGHQLAANIIYEHLLELGLIGEN